MKIKLATAAVVLLGLTGCASTTESSGDGAPPGYDGYMYLIHNSQQSAELSRLKDIDLYERGLSACQSLNQNVEVGSVVHAEETSDSFSEGAADLIVIAASFDLCPQYRPLVEQYASAQ